ncbi:MAG: hypothetical protein AB7F90_02695, partial [Nitrospirales bacterium]
NSIVSISWRDLNVVMMSLNDSAQTIAREEGDSYSPHTRDYHQTTTSNGEWVMSCGQPFFVSTW